MHFDSCLYAFILKLIQFGVQQIYLDIIHQTQLRPKSMLHQLPNSKKKVHIEHSTHNRISKTQQKYSEKTSGSSKSTVPISQTDRKSGTQAQTLNQQQRHHDDRANKKNRDKSHHQMRRSHTESAEYQRFNERLHTIQDKIAQLKMRLDKKKKKKEMMRHKIREQRRQKLQQKQPPVEQKKGELGNFITKEKKEKTKSPSFKLRGLVTHEPEPHSPKRKSSFSFRNNPYYLSSVMDEYKDEQSIVREHIRNSIQFLTYLTSMTLPLYRNKRVYLPIKKGYENKITLIFDLDETLIHCIDELEEEPHQIKLPIIFPTGQKIMAGINIRPHAFEILKELSPHFQIIVFTASHPCYADVVLNYLDPQKKYIHHRLYRQHCYLVPGGGPYVKDLRIINRDLSKVVLVDNAAYSYAFQVQNGIPIIPYYEGKQDYQLIMLKQYLNKLKQVEDVRQINRKTFQLARYTEYDSDEIDQLVESLYIKSKK